MSCSQAKDSDLSHFVQLVNAVVRVPKCPEVVSPHDLRFAVGQGVYRFLLLTA